MGAFYRNPMWRAVIVLLVCMSAVLAQDYTTTGSNLKIPQSAAVCWSYYAPTTTSNNLYAHVSLYASPALSITSKSISLGSCMPNSAVNNTCSTSENNQFSFVSYEAQYVLACLECHYWLGPCIFDKYSVTLTETGEDGSVPCYICN